MTIGIAFRCGDGILIAGDRLRTKGDSGTFVTKVRAFRPRKNLVGAMIGAGTSGFINAMFDRANEVLKDNMALLEAKLSINRARRRIYEEEMKPTFEEGVERPHFSLLIALWSRTGGFVLLQGASDTPMSVVDEDNYKSIGTGAPLANCLVRTFYSLNGTCEEAALISAMALKLVKGFVPGCGGGTNIIAVMEGGLAKPKSKIARKKVEGQFLDFFRSVKVDLREFIKSRRQNPLMVRRFPREEKTRHGSQR